MKTFLIGSGIALLVFGTVPVALSQGTAHDHPAPAAGAQQQPAAPAGGQAMMAQMQAQQKKLDDLVAQMNAATGAAKTDRIAAVVTELVAMHKQMSGMMMQGGMMQMMHGGQAAPAPTAPPAK